jgi:hypothetical protein
MESRGLKHQINVVVFHKASETKEVFGVIFGTFFLTPMTTITNVSGHYLHTA